MPVLKVLWSMNFIFSAIWNMTLWMCSVCCHLLSLHIYRLLYTGNFFGAIIKRHLALTLWGTSLFPMLYKCHTVSEHCLWDSVVNAEYLRWSTMNLWDCPPKNEALKRQHTGSFRWRCPVCHSSYSGCMKECRMVHNRGCHWRYPKTILRDGIHTSDGYNNGLILPKKEPLKIRSSLYYTLLHPYKHR